VHSKMLRNPVLAALFPSKEKFWPNIISGMMASFSYATAGMILKAENLNKRCLHPASTHNRGFRAIYLIRDDFYTFATTCQYFLSLNS
jgi:hypothetical protein